MRNKSSLYAVSTGQIRLPDIPQWVEPNDSLVNGRAEVFLFDRHDLEHIALLDVEQTLYVVGRLSKDDIEKLGELLPRCTSMILEADQDEGVLSFLGAQAMKKILVFTRPLGLKVSSDQYPNAMLVDGERLGNAKLDSPFREELIDALEHSPISAPFSESGPVAFCYAASQSQRFWDVSVDTLGEHRRKGFAKQCALHMMSLMESQGKQVVWQSFEDNPPSWKLARSLGLVETSQLWFWERNHP